MQNDFETEDDEVTEGPLEEVTKAEIRHAIASMKNGKAPGPSGLVVELIKGAGETAVQVLRGIFQSILFSGKVPPSWQSSVTIPLYKGKGDAMECGNYRGIRLLEHGMKIFEKVLEMRLKKLIQIDERQFGFRTGKSTTDAIFILRQLQEKYCVKQKRLFHVFVDLQKAFDSVPRKVIAWALKPRNICDVTTKDRRQRSAPWQAHWRSL